MIGSIAGREQPEARVTAHDYVPKRLLKAAAGYTAVTFLYVAIVLATGHAPRIPFAQDHSVSRTAQEIASATPIPVSRISDVNPAPTESMMPSPAPAMTPSIVATERFPVAPAPAASPL